MKIRRFTLQFRSPISGILDSFKIYGAILNAIYEIDGGAGDQLCTAIKQGEFRISTILPRLKHRDYDIQYLPVPKFWRVLTAQVFQEVNDDVLKKTFKEMKKINYLSENALRFLVEKLNSGSREAVKWIIERIEDLRNDDTKSFTYFLRSAFKPVDIPKNAQKRIRVSPNLYYDRVKFPKDILLNSLEKAVLNYSILVEYEDKDMLSLFCLALELLEDRGIGRKISVGCGSFKVVDVDSWKPPTQNKDYKYVMLLSNAILKDENMKNLHKDEGNFYTYSVCYGYNRAGERIPVTYYLNPGSVIMSGYDFKVREIEHSAINYTLVGMPLTIPFPSLE